MLGRDGAPEPPGVDGLRIRPMRHRDLDAVAAIESQAFGSPWRRGSYGRAITTSPRQFVVAEMDGELVGYAGFWVEQRKAHVAKVAVHPDYRRRGIAQALLEHLLDAVRRLGLGYAYLEVRKSNQGAQELYRRLGFHFERVQPKAYPDNGEDALIFARDNLLDPAARRPATVED
ncbi:MAG: ribosomal protein S18-alanine N-acetyltransferase [Planctomycetota bacterium]